MRIGVLFIFIVTALIGGACFITGWYGYFNLNQDCLVHGYELSSGEAMRCAKVKVTFFPGFGSKEESVRRDVSAFISADCWTLETTEKVEAMMKANYPLGQIHSCYRSKDWFWISKFSSSGDTIYFSHPPMLSRVVGEFITFFGMMLGGVCFLLSIVAGVCLKILHTKETQSQSELSEFTTTGETSESDNSDAQQSGNDHVYQRIVFVPQNLPTNLVITPPATVYGRSVINEPPPPPYTPPATNPYTDV